MQTRKKPNEQYHKMFPHTYAHYCTHGKWKMFPHLAYISQTIMRDLVKGNARYIIEMPPRHGKSTFISIWLPLWLLEVFKDYNIILASYGAKLAEYFVSLMIESISVYNRIGLTLNKKSMSRALFRTNEGGQVLATGIGGVTIGFGANTFLIDDIHKNWMEAMSESIRERNIEWFKTTATTRLEKGGNIIVLGTRWSDKDLIGWIKKEGIDEESNFKTISIKAICEDEEEDPLGRKEGDPICEQLFSYEDLMVKKEEMGDPHFQSHYQNEPVSAKGNIIHFDDIQFYETQDTLPVMDRKIIVADLSYQETMDGSFTCVECWGTFDGKFVLLDTIRERCDFARQKEMIREMSARHKDALEVYVEKYANGQAAIEDLKYDISGLRPYAPRTSKEARLHVVSPLFKNQKVYYPMDDIIDINIREITHFPFYKTNDTVDCATMALSILKETDSAVTFYKKLLGKSDEEE